EFRRVVRDQIPRVQPVTEETDVGGAVGAPARLRDRGEGGDQISLGEVSGGFVRVAAKQRVLQPLLVGEEARRAQLFDGFEVAQPLVYLGGGSSLGVPVAQKVSVRGGEVVDQVHHALLIRQVSQRRRDA